MTLKINSTVKLHDRIEMPIFGLGLYRTKSGTEAQNAVKWAFEVGYRHFDTAQIYGNEQDVGRALKTLDCDREDFFVTTKIWNDNQGSKTIPSFQKSLEKLQLTYVDLLLIHWPVKDKRLDTFREMVKLKDDNLVRTIGVSNYMTWHLKELIETSSEIPTVNQVEFSPYLYDKELHEMCKDHKIQLESYSPLTKGKMLNDPKLVQLAKKYEKTPAQLLIRWNLEHNIIVIPKSSKQKRIMENSQVFDFNVSNEDLEEMDSWNRDLVTGWNPRIQE